MRHDFRYGGGIVEVANRNVDLGDVQFFERGQPVVAVGDLKSTVAIRAAAYEQIVPKRGVGDRALQSGDLFLVDRIPITRCVVAGRRPCLRSKADTR
jgi:hypothetical protein